MFNLLNFYIMKTLNSQNATFRGFTLYPSKYVGTIYAVPTAAKYAKSGLAWSLPCLVTEINSLRAVLSGMLAKSDYISDFSSSLSYLFTNDERVLLSLLLGPQWKSLGIFEASCSLLSAKHALSDFCRVAELSF